MKQKENEIREFCLERLEEIADHKGFEDFSEMDISDLHHQIFNAIIHATHQFNDFVIRQVHYLLPYSQRGDCDQFSYCQSLI